MSIDPDPTRLRLRWWPPFLLLAVGLFCFIVLPIAFNRTLIHFAGMVGGPILCSVGFLVWWAFGSRVRGSYRWWPVVLYLVLGVVLILGLYRKDATIAVAIGVPFVVLLWFGWLLLSFAVPTSIRLFGVLVVIVVGWGAFASVRIDGAAADMQPTLSFRWTKTDEEKFAEELANRPHAEVPIQAIVVQAEDIAEFRGPKRDGVYSGEAIRTEWSKNPPKLLWKQRIGPGWGSFAVVGDRLFTMEQRGEDETIVCYAADTGHEIWEHHYPARFEESFAQSGPRSTPTIVEGKLYAMGATGVLTCLDAASGAKVWSLSLPERFGATVPMWGFSCSPLVVNGLVVVCPQAGAGKGTVAVRAENGDTAWTSGDAQMGYSSAQRATLNGVEQVLMLSGFGLEAFEIDTGKRLWAFELADKNSNRVSQPVILDDTDVILSTGVGPDQGLKRVHVTKTGDNWNAALVWNSPAAKPYFNDGVIHEGHFYGYDGKAVVCVELEKGRLKWSAGNVYGNGQLLLLPDQDLLVVQAVDGRLVLVEANPEEYVELEKFPALDGKTWNHPVFAHGRFYLRNSKEAACYECGNGKE